MELRDVRNEFDSLSLSVKLLTSGTQNLDNLLGKKIKGVRRALASWKIIHILENPL